jgi:pyruvate dehydrogenase E1 component beta subunit
VLVPTAMTPTATDPAGDAGGDSQVTLLDAIRLALIEEMERDNRVLVLGMDVGTLGGVFRVTRGLAEMFGPDRVVDTPLAEAAIIGASVGLAIGGMVPVAEIQFLGFTHQALHQVAQQLARFRARSRGRYPMPVTVRAPCGGGLRTPEFHADAVEAQLAQIPGLKVVCPAFPEDAHDLLVLAIRDPDPVVVVEPQRLYRSVRGPLRLGGEALPFGCSRLVRSGTDLTLIAWSAAVHLCLAASDRLQEFGISAGVLDLRTISPLDVDGLISAVEETTRAVVVHEAPLSGGFGAEVAATLHEELFASLRAPVARVTSWDLPYPPGALEDGFLPSVERVVAAARRTVERGT